MLLTLNRDFCKWPVLRRRQANPNAVLPAVLAVLEEVAPASAVLDASIVAALEVRVSERLGKPARASLVPLGYRSSVQFLDSESSKLRAYGWVTRKWNSHVYYKHDSISTCFVHGDHAGMQLYSLVEGLSLEDVDVSDFTLDCFLFHGKVRSLRNRQLFCMKVNRE